MRQKIQKQPRLVEQKIDHAHSDELVKISELLDGQPELAELVHADLVRGLRDPDAGREGLSGDQALRAVVIKQMNGFSYDELEFHLGDSRCYRGFCRIGFADNPPSKSALQRAIKKVSEETLAEINRRLLLCARDLGVEDGRSVRIDCTVTATNIHEPLDSALLLDGVETLARLMAKTKEDCGIAFTDHRRAAKRRALGILNAKNEKVRTALYRKLLKLTHKTLADVSRVLAELQRAPGSLAVITVIGQLEHFLPLVRRVVDQTERRVLRKEQVPASEKLVSIFEPHSDIIIKDRRDVHYGHKVALAVGASGLVTDINVLGGNPADSTLTIPMLERQREVYGRLPKSAAFDGGFASKDNLAAAKQLGVENVAFSKKRGLEVSEMTTSERIYRRLRDFRAGVEGIISFLKRCFGLRRCTWSGLESFKAYCWSSVVAANLLLLARRLLA